MRDATFVLGTQLMLVTATICGCGDSEPAENYALRPDMILFSPMFSAYGGSQTYSLTPYVPVADPATKDSDPVMAATIKWQVDATHAKQDVYADIPGAIKLTTKAAGKTKVSMTATTASGAKIRSESMLNITKASDDQWALGDARYGGGVNIDFTMLGPRNMMAPSMGGGSCGLPFDILSALPKEASCTNCHNTSASAIAVEHTPTQTAGYSDEQLIAIFTQGQKPAGYTFNSFFLKMLPQPDCVYSMFHTWTMDESTKQGIVLKLRSLPPQKQEAIDLAKIVQMFGGMRPPPSGAAGTPSM